MQIKRYGLVVKYSVEELVNAVTAEAQQGWLPTGGVATAREAATPQTKARTSYAQAMVLPYTMEDSIGKVVAQVNGHA